MNRIYHRDDPHQKLHRKIDQDGDYYYIDNNLPRYFRPPSLSIVTLTSETSVIILILILNLNFPFFLIVWLEIFTTITTKTFI